MNDKITTNIDRKDKEKQTKIFYRYQSVDYFVIELFWNYKHVDRDRDSLIFMDYKRLTLFSM